MQCTLYCQHKLKKKKVSRLWLLQKDNHGVKDGNIMTHDYPFSFAYIQLYLGKKKKREKKFNGLPIHWNC